MKRVSALLFIILGLSGCSESDDDTSAEGGDTTGEAGDTGDTGGDAVEPVLELTTELCQDPANMDILVESEYWGALIANGGFNQEQVDRMVEDSTAGPFYMFNLIHYREWAEYPDGRESDLTGREANALYDPSEFLQAIGANVVFNTEVDQQIDGDDIEWETVAVVEYPCPVAFFAMLTHPEFQEKAVHKTAGVERTIIIVTDLNPVAAPTDPDQSEAAFPPTPDDPAFDLIHVMDFHEIAQYDPALGEPERTGKEAWEEYQKAGSGASVDLGHYLTAELIVQGVLSGDDRTFDEIQIVHMSSQAGFQALLDNPEREAAKYHRIAALAHNYSMITFPSLSSFPTIDPMDPVGLPVTEDGTGTPCTTDADCPGDGVDKCITDGSGGPGFCSREGCGAGECQSPYLCCHDCAPEAAPALPFEGSACFPDDLAASLTSDPVACTCD